jgi:hypothetical protein
MELLLFAGLLGKDIYKSCSESLRLVSAQTLHYFQLLQLFDSLTFICHYFIIDDSISYLHEKGADVNSVNSFGCNAVLWAAQSNRMGLHIIQFLEEIGCDLELINSNGHGIVHKSAQRGKLDVCEWMFSRMKLFRVSGCRREMNHNSDAFTINIPNMLRMIAPDKENCCPSDLAGQANCHQLAKFLIDCETEICMEAIKSNPEDIPSWLKEGILNSKHLSNRSNLHELYESGAAIKKIASFVVTNTNAMNV